MNKIVLIIFVVIVILGLGAAAFYLLTRGAPQLPQQTPAPLLQTPFPTLYPFGSTTPFPLIGLPSPSPTPSATPSASATPRATITPTPTARVTATLPPDIPVTGSSDQLIIGVGVSLVLILAAFYLQLGNQ